MSRSIDHRHREKVSAEVFYQSTALFYIVELTPLHLSPGKTTVARLYYRFLNDIGVFAGAKEKAREARAVAAAEAKRQADEAEKARKDRERQMFQAAGLPYNPTSNSSVSQGTPASSLRSSTNQALSGFVETTGADLADKGVRGLKEMLTKIRTAGGGVLFVDEVRKSYSLIALVAVVLLASD